MSDDITGADVQAADTALSGGSDPAPASPPAASQDTAAIAPATEIPPDPRSTDPSTSQGPIPFQVHKTALDNARAKAVEEYRQQYGGATPEQFGEMAQWYRQAHADPLTFATELVTALQQDPRYAQQLRSMAARALQQGRGQAPPSDLPVIQLEDGRTVDLNALRAQWMEEADAKYGPALQTAQELKAEREQVRAQAQADTFAKDFLTDVRREPLFTDLEPQIKAELARAIQAGQVGDHPKELENAVRTIYIRLAIPQLQSTTQRTMLQDIHRKAAAGTVQPGMSGARAPKTIDEMSLAEALAHTAATMTTG